MSQARRFLTKFGAASLHAACSEPEQRAGKYNVYQLYYDVRTELLLRDELTPMRRDEVLEFATDFQVTEGFAAGMFDPEPKRGAGTRKAPRDRWVARGGFAAFTAFSVLTLEHTLFRR